jgi:DNA repair exonuclease SbcCD nuclease subunit
MDRFGSIAPVPVFITPGNHDPYLPQSPYNADFLAEKEKGKWTENVHIFSSNSFQTVCLEARDDVTVTGIANVGREFEQRRILGERISLPEAAVNILMVHGSREPFPPGKEATMPFSDAELLSRGFDYAAIGHYHTYAEVKDGQGRIRGAYSGTPASQRLSEVGEKFVLLGEIAEDKTVRLEKVRLDRRALHSIEVNCCGLTHSEAVIRKVEEEAGKTSNNRDDILFIRLAGRFPCGESLKLPADLLADKYFHVATDTSGLQPDYDLDKYLQEPELIRGVDGDYVKALLNQEAQAPGERERRVIRAALYYGLDALEEGKLCGRYED